MAARLTSKGRSPEFTLLDICFSILDIVHDGGADARAAIPECQMFKTTNRLLTGNDEGLAVVNQVLTQLEMTPQIVDIITKVWAKGSQKGANSTEEAYKIWMETPPGPGPRVPFNAMVSALKSNITESARTALRCPEGYMPNSVRRLEKRYYADYSRPSKLDTFSPVQFDPAYKDVKVIEISDVIAGRADPQNRRPLIGPSACIDPGPKMTDKEYRAIVPREANYDIDGVLLRCGPRVRRLFIREMQVTPKEPARYGRPAVKAGVKAKLVLEIDVSRTAAEPKSMFVPISSDFTLEHSSRFLQNALDKADFRRVNFMNGFIGGNKAAEELIRNGTPEQKTCAMTSKLEGDASVAEFNADNNLTAILGKGVQELHEGMGPALFDLSTATYESGSFDGLCNSHLERILTTGKKNTLFHKPTHGGKFTLEITPGPGNIAEQSPQDLLNKLKENILEQFNVFAASWDSGVIVYDGEDVTEITMPYVDMVKGQLADLRKTFVSHIEGLGYDDLLENRGALTPSQSTFKGKRSVAPLVYICKIRIGDSLQVYRICPSDDIGKIKAHTSSTVLGVHRRKDKKAIKFPTEAPAQSEAPAEAPAQSAGANDGGMRSRRSTKRVKAARRTRRRRQARMRGGVHEDIIRFADQLLNFYSLDQCDDDDRDLLLASERGKIRSYTNIDDIHRALTEPPGDPDLIWEDTDRSGYKILLQDIDRKPLPDGEMHPHKREALAFLDNEFYRFLVFCRNAVDPPLDDDFIINCFIRLPPETNLWQETLVPAYAAFKTRCAVAYRQAEHAEIVRTKLVEVNKKRGSLKGHPVPFNLVSRCREDGELMAALKQLTLGEDVTHAAKFAEILDQIDPPSGIPAPSDRPLPPIGPRASAALPFSDHVSLPSFAAAVAPPAAVAAVAAAAPPPFAAPPAAVAAVAAAAPPPFAAPPFAAPPAAAAAQMRAAPPPPADLAALHRERQDRAAAAPPPAAPDAMQMNNPDARAAKRRRASAPGVVNGLAKMREDAAREAAAAAPAPGAPAAQEVVMVPAGLRSSSNGGRKTHRRRRLPKLL